MIRQPKEDSINTQFTIIETMKDSYIFHVTSILGRPSDAWLPWPKNAPSKNGSSVIPKKDLQ